MSTQFKVLDRDFYSEITRIKKYFSNILVSKTASKVELTDNLCAIVRLLRKSNLDDATLLKLAMLEAKLLLGQDDKNYFPSSIVTLVANILWLAQNTNPQKITDFDLDKIKSLLKNLENKYDLSEFEKETLQTEFWQVGDQSFPVYRYPGYAGMSQLKEIGHSGVFIDNSDVCFVKDGKVSNITGFINHPTVVSKDGKNTEFFEELEGNLYGPTRLHGDPPSVIFRLGRKELSREEYFKQRKMLPAFENVEFFYSSSGKHETEALLAMLLEQTSKDKKNIHVVSPEGFTEVTFKFNKISNKYELDKYMLDFHNLSQEVPENVYPSKTGIHYHKMLDSLPSVSMPLTQTFQVKDYNEIPSGFTGIAEYSSGTKEWYKEGKLHREDGPACEYADGTKSWWREGIRHREDGPAYENTAGRKEWYLNGIEFSSETAWKAELEKRSMKTIQVKDIRDIPFGFTGIVEYSNGSKAWYKEGKRHRENGPAIEYADGTKRWYKEGSLHREDGPAVEYASGTKKWCLDGASFSSEEEWKAELEKRNMKTIQVKNPHDIPSGFTGIVEYSNGTKAWYENRKFHREDGPAVEYADGAREWWKEGKLHREDGPAIEYASGRKEWYLNGIEFSSEEHWKAELEKQNLKTIQIKDFRDIPSGFTGIAEYSSGTKEWYKEGKNHREDGPAYEHPNGSKSWWRNGKLHREDGPACEYPDGSKSWYLDGIELSSEGEWKAELEKQNLKTIQIKDYSEIPSSFTGIVEWVSGTKEWYKEGKNHREDGPAYEHPSGKKSWWRNGKLHREDGPAVEYASGRKEWYLNGIEFSSEEEWKAELEKRNMKTIQVKDSSEIPSGFTGIVEWASGTKEWYKEGKLHREDGPAVEYAGGSKSWFKEGKLHREDGPAIECADGRKFWYLDGTSFSSEEKWKAELEKRSLKTIRVKDSSEIPSGFTGIIEYADRTKVWLKEGKGHREDGPAIEHADGRKFWYLNGIEFSSEEKWKLKTIRVKQDYEIPSGFTGIAEYDDGEKHWYKDRKHHREDGPALELANGDKFWYKEGELHREDGPACEHASGSKFWYLNGIEFSSEEEWKAELEKRSLKTIQIKDSFEIPSGFTGIAKYPDRTKVWLKEGKLHREDGPAIEWASGAKSWYKEGKFIEYQEKEEKTTTKTTESNLNFSNSIDLEKLKQEVGLATIRTISKKTTKSLKNLFIDLLIPELDLKKKKKKKVIKKLETFLKSPLGEIFISMLLGVGIGFVEEYIPKRFRKTMLLVAEEFRVRAIALAQEEFVDRVVFPATSKIMQEFSQSFSENEDEGTLIRVETDFKSPDETEPSFNDSVIEARNHG